MLSTDRDAFDGLMVRLCSGFKTPNTTPRRDAYWRGFSKGSLVEFERLVDIALEVWEGTEAPTVSELRKLKYAQRASAPEPKQLAVDNRDTLLRFANRECLRLMVNRQGLGKSLPKVRKEIVGLVDWFQAPVAEGDESATPAAFLEMLTKALGEDVDDLTRKQWLEIARMPGGQDPFPSYMARDYQPSTAQLELTP